MKYIPHDYQSHATDAILDREGVGLFIDMGLGKTVISLTAIRDILFNRLEDGKFLIIAPKRVAEITWKAEARKWDHTKGLRLAVVAGTEKQRIAALATDSDVYVVGRDNLTWLANFYGRKWPFPFVVADELSSFKNPESKRFKSLRKVRPLIRRFIGLTGTPAPKSLLDLWSQLFLIDRGERLGKTLTGYRTHYFRPGEGNGQTVFNYVLRKGAEAAIYEIISDVCISMKASDYLSLPDRLDQDVEIDLPPELRQQYDELEEELILSIAGDTITAANSAVILNKLAQFANGAVYAIDDQDRRVVRHIHDLKIDAVRDDLEAMNGKPFLLFYEFRHDLDRLMTAFADYEPRELKTNKDVEDWNAGKIRLMICHPASAGHGLNLQDGGSVMGWFGLTWNLELYLQAIHRLDRQGQKNVVRNRRYVVKGTVDLVMLARIYAKDATQNRLLDAVKAMIRSRIADLV